MREADSSAKEQLLAAAGFQIRPANTPKRQAFLQSQEPYKLNRHLRNGNYYYSYANPQTQTLFVGGAAEYARYQELAVKQNIATQQWAASQNEMAAADWNAWGPWSGGGMGFGGSTAPIRNFP